MTRQEYIKKLASKQVLVLDGGMGTMLQRSGLEPSDFCLSSVLDDVAEDSYAVGCNELLSVTRPDVIFDIHTAYLQAGADIIETNTFCANAFSLEEYGLQDHVYSLNRAACEIARQAVEVIEEEYEERYAFVAGIMGPTGRGLSFSSSVDDPAYRQNDFFQFKAMYAQQAKALVEGGVDLILIETVFDTLVCKAALEACHEVFIELDRQLPIMVSVTFSDKSARTLSGQDLHAFVVSLSHEHLFSLGMNCSTGAGEMVPLIRELAELSPFRVSAHPNAGFPDKDGVYTQIPQQMASQLAPALHDGCLNIVGGCCGTTPEHIAAIAAIAKESPVHVVETALPVLKLSGLDALVLEPGHRMVVIGERTNVAGSKKFARLISQEKWDEALSVARSQVEQGAQVIDICMDASMIDAPKAMVTFLRYVASDPSISQVPIMVDSSDWTVIEAALGELQGRGIVNSISLKEGPEQFLAKAKSIAHAGHAMVVMLFDENGQADTFERKIEIAERSYGLLVEGGIPATSIIFDPNVLAIATGIEEHDGYARDFIEAVRWIKENLPGVSTSGGISNLSFSFRGNNKLREAMHAVFLYYACKAGLDMAIVNPSSECSYASIPAHALAIIEEALLLTRGDGPAAREALIGLALSNELSDLKTDASQPVNNQWRTFGVEERILHAVMTGDDSYLTADIQELLESVKEKQLSPVTIVEGPLMQAMGKVGILFGDGKLFLPQVVRSARTMKHAVDILQPAIEEYLLLHDGDSDNRSSNKTGTIVLATVKGDVHDIGKNIVGLVLACNNFEVIDLGVMVPPQQILAAAVEHHADIVGLSGLITPSLSEMAIVCEMFQKEGLSIPIMVGGATTSEVHTALKLAPRYGGPVVHTSDASAMAHAALKLVSDQKADFVRSMNARYEELNRGLDSISKLEIPCVLYQEALSRRYVKEGPVPAPQCLGIKVFDDIRLDELLPLVNWDMLAVGWKVPIHSQEAEDLIKDAKALVHEMKYTILFESSIRSVVGLFNASSDGMTVTLSLPGSSETLGELEVVGNLHFLRRQQLLDGRPSLSLADYVLPDHDCVALFAVTAGIGVAPVVQGLKDKGDSYHAILLQMIADRLAEACVEATQKRIAGLWEYEKDGLNCLRPAPGYPTWPDHSEKAEIFRILEVTKRIGIGLTEHYAMDPAASVCGCMMVGKDLRYFSVGPVPMEQLEIYAQAKDVAVVDLATVIQGME